MRYVHCVVLVAFLGACGEQEVTQPPTSEAKKAPAITQFATYQVENIDHLGGSFSEANSISNSGLTAGRARLSTNERRAVFWRDGVIQNLETLGGAHSAVLWAGGVNNSGMVVGISYTGILDTLPGTWSCGAFLPATNRTCLGFFWEEGAAMAALPTFGGDNGFATAVNNRGQVVGWAETPVHDPTCDLPLQALQFRAALWEPKKGTMVQLPPFPGDSTSAATGINERGQAIGISGECDQAVGRFSAQHAVLWQQGQVLPLDDLGGTSWHTPMAINQAGDITGFSNPPDARDLLGEFIAHAVLWTPEGGIQDLGRLPGDSTSQGLGLNIFRQVVGVSAGPAGSRAFLWQDGTLVDLNSIVDPAYPDSLIIAGDINDDGVITGRARVAATGRIVTFIARPITP